MPEIRIASETNPNIAKRIEDLTLEDYVKNYHEMARSSVSDRLTAHRATKLFDSLYNFMRQEALDDLLRWEREVKPDFKKGRE